MCQKLFIDFIFSLSRKCLKIGTLYISNNLNTIQIKMIKKPVSCKAGLLTSGT